MADYQPIDFERYRDLVADGGTAHVVYSRVREDGGSKLDGVLAIRQLFDISFHDAQAVVRDVNLPADRSEFELAPVRSFKELEQVLKDELGYCGCSSFGEAIEVLRDVLRCARDWQEALHDETNQRREQAHLALLERLKFDQVPGLATWFLYAIDQRNLISHAGNVKTCWIERKGLQLLEAIERFYPPPHEVDEAEPG